jgi:hypothetical protein
MDHVVVSIKEVFVVQRVIVVHLGVGVVYRVKSKGRSIVKYLRDVNWAMDYVLVMEFLRVQSVLNQRCLLAPPRRLLFQRAPMHL